MFLNLNIILKFFWFPTQFSKQFQNRFVKSLLGHVLFSFRNGARNRFRTEGENELWNKVIQFSKRNAVLPFLIPCRLVELSWLFRAGVGEQSGTTLRNKRGTMRDNMLDKWPVWLRDKLLANLQIRIDGLAPFPDFDATEKQARSSENAMEWKKTVNF